MRRATVLDEHVEAVIAGRGYLQVMSDADAARPQPRLLTLRDVAEVLNVREEQVKALVRTGDLSAARIGARGIWRVDPNRLDAYIEELHERTALWVEEHPYVDEPDELHLVVSRPASDEPGFMSARQAAEALGVTRQNVDYLIKTGWLRGTKIDGRWRIWADDVDSYRPQDGGVGDGTSTTGSAAGRAQRRPR